MLVTRQLIDPINFHRIFFFFKSMVNQWIIQSILILSDKISQNQLGFFAESWLQAKFSGKFALNKQQFKLVENI